MLRVLLLLLLPSHAHGERCVDSHDDCRYWAYSGECRRNAEWMGGKCPASCGLCLGECADSLPTCEEWASKNECVENQRYTRRSHTQCTPHTVHRASQKLR